MTTSLPPRPGVGPAAGDTSPLVELDKLISCSAGTSATFEVFVTHRGPTAANLRITVLGLDGRWVPPPLPVGPIEPGETTRITLSLVPERGTLGAKYPFVVAAEATPVGGNGQPVMGVAESTLAVDSRDPISMTLTPQSAVAVFSQRVKVQITNPGRFDRELSLTASAARGASLSLSSTMITVPAGRTVTVPGRVRVTHPRLVGHQSTHTFAVAARGLGAPEFMEGTLRSRPLMGGRMTGLLVAALVIAIWATAAVVGIPKLSNYLSSKSTQAAQSTTQLAPGAANATSGGATPASGGAGAAQSGAGGAGGSGGAAGSGGAGAGGAAGSAGAGGAAAGGSSAADGQLSGTVTGTTPKGVQVSLEPTSLVEAAGVGAQPAAGATDAATASALRSISDGPLGKVPGDAVRIAPAATDSGIRTTKSAADGSFSFAGITAPGYYLLTLAKPGYATQRYVINAATLDAATPIKVALVPGNGSLSGSVTSASGAVGAASVTITDGTVALQTSTVSKGITGARPGSWTVNGLSTPGTYLVTVGATGYGAESTLVTLAAGGTGKANLSLKTGVAAINGLVTGVDGLGHLGPVGGVTVSATGTSRGVAASRTATTVTSGPVGTFALPDLPTPGDYTVTVSGPGYASQTRQVTLAEGSSSATVNVSLTRADGTVSGTVVGDGNEGGLIGAGLTLTGSQVSYKTMTTSAPAGSFRFTGVPPGTYVLQASQYGRVPSSATVVVTAAGSATVNLHLVGAPDTELPDTSHIRGRAVDSRTQGPLTCDRAATTVAPANCVVTATTLVPLDPAKGTSGGTQTIHAISDKAGNYTLPSVADTKHPGLVAGLYQVTLSAPGYEPTTISVQVAQGQTVAAPQVSLSPLGLITGTVTARVGTPTSPSCVVAVPAAASVPTACTPTSATSCTVADSPSARCSMTADDGSYEIRGLVHGGYQVVVLPTDREYLPSQALAVQLDLGGDFRYDAVLDRLGRVTVTVLQANPLSLALTPAKGAAVTIHDKSGNHGNPLPGDSTRDDGILTITGLQGSYTASATGRISTGDPDALVNGSASTPTGVVALNQTVTLTMVLTAPVGAVVGHVTVAVDGQGQDVAGATVQVNGIVGFNGRNTVSGTVSVKTDANGCYAIIPAVWSGHYPLRSADCPTPVGGASVVTIKDGSGAAQSLVALPLSLNVAQFGLQTQSYSASGVVITGTGQVRAIPPINLLAQPSAVPVLTLSLSAPGGISTDASAANIVVTRKPAGAGNVTVSAAPNGTLTWTDSNLGTGKAVPGLYQLTSTDLGYASSTSSMWCGLGVACRFGSQATAEDSWFQYLLPSISGTIIANDLPGADLPAGSPGKVTLDQAIVTVDSKPSAAGSISVSVDRTGKVTFQDLSLQISGLPGNLAQPTPPSGSPYQFTVSLPGYSSGSIAVNCGTDYRHPCDPLSATLKPLPRFSGSVTATSTIPAVVPLHDLNGITVSFSAQPNPTKPVAVKVDTTTGALTWQDPTQPINVVSYGDYSMTFAKPGYQSVTEAFSCSVGSTTCLFNGGAPVHLDMFPSGDGSVSVGAPLVAGQPVNWASATVTLATAPAGTAGLKISVVPGPDATTGKLVWADSGLPYAGITVPGTYALTVALPGYGSADSPPVTCNAGGSCNPIVGTLKSFPHAGGSVSITAQLPGTTDPKFDWTKNAVVTLTSQAPGSSLLSLKLVQDPANPLNAALNWSDPSLPAPGITWPGTYVVSVSIPGYATGTSPAFTCSVGDTAVCGPALALTRLPGVTGKVTIQPTIDTPVQGLDGISVAINPQPSPTHPIAVTVSATDGSISWNDPLQPAGLVSPGTYNLTFSKSGYLPVTTAFSCAATQTTCDVGTINLQMDPQGAGSVTAAVPAQNAQSVDWSQAKVTLLSQPANTFTLGITLAADPGNALKADFNWADSALPFPGITLPGTYQIKVALPGYGSATSAPFTCSAGQKLCGPDLTLTQQPTFTGTVATNPPNGSLLGTVVSVTSPAGVNAVTATVAATAADPTNGTINWQEAGAPAGLVSYGTYQISVSLAGYLSPPPAVFSCTAQSCPALNLVLTAPSKLALTVESADGGAVNGPTVDLSGSLISTVTVTAPANSNVVSFPSLSPLGDYSVTVHAAGFADSTVDKDTAAVTCTDSAGTDHQGLAVWPGGTTSCVITLKALGSITLQTSGVTRAADKTVLTSVALGSVPVTVQRLTTGGVPTGPVFSGTTSGTGALVITGTNAAQGLLSGTWQVKASQTGYASVTGTVLIAPDTFAMAADPADPDMPVVGGVLQVRLDVNPVALQVHLVVGGTESLPAVTVSLTGGPAPLACTIKKTGTTYSCTEADPTINVVGTGGNYVNFSQVTPGVYTVTVSSGSSTYRTVTLLAQVVAGVSPQQLVISLDVRASSQGGTMTLADGTHPAGMVATLRAPQNIAVIANDQNGQPLTATTDASGHYQFTGIPDGNYTLVGEYPGYAFGQITGITENSANLPQPPVDIANLQLTTRALVPVTLNLTATAKQAADGSGVLSGAGVVLKPLDPPVAGLAADVQQTVLIPSGAGPKYAVVLPQLPTGKWGVSIVTQTGAPFGGTLSPDNITVPQPAVTPGAIPVSAFGIDVQQSLVNLTATFKNNACVTAPTSLTFTITQSGSTAKPTVTAPVIAGTTTSTATAQVYLPEGSYSYVPTLDPNMFSTTPIDFTVGTPSGSGSEVTLPDPPPLVPASYPVAATMKVDGDGAGANGLVLTATSGGSPTPPPATFDATGSATLCLKPASWTVSVSAGATSSQVSVPDATVEVSDTSTDTLALTADTVTPSVALQAVAGRVDTSTTKVSVVIRRDAKDVGPASSVDVTAATPGTGTPIILGTCDGCQYTVTATPPPGVFGAVTDQKFDLSKSLALPVTLPYTAAMATVTVTRPAAGGPAPGATVTITPADQPAQTTDETGTTIGRTVFQDLKAQAYTFTANWDDTSVTPSVHYHGSTTLTLAAGQNPVSIPLTGP